MGIVWTVSYRLSSVCACCRVLILRHLAAAVVLSRSWVAERRLLLNVCYFYSEAQHLYKTRLKYLQSAGFFTAVVPCSESVH